MCVWGGEGRVVEKEETPMQKEKVGGRKMCVCAEGEGGGGRKNVAEGEGRRKKVLCVCRGRGGGVREINSEGRKERETKEYV